MKDNIFNAIKIVLADRLVTILVAAMVLIALAYCGYVALSLHPSDLQVAVHYTAYGETHFYREKWHYLLSFIGLGLVIAVLHGALAVKLYILERRQLAIYFIWTSLLVLVIAWILTAAVLRVAFR